MAEAVVVMPTYNERSNLEAMIARVRAAVPDADVLIVDDASPDGTGALADELAQTDAHVRVLHRAAKQGLGRAYVDAFGVALERGYRLVATIDADGSHDPGDLPEMLAVSGRGADLVIGSRWVAGGAVQNWPRSRQAISRGGNRYARAMLGSAIHDLTAGFRVYRSTLLSRLHLESVASAGYCFQVEMAWRAERSGARVVEYPITFVERAKGRSKMHAGIVAEALTRVTLWGVGTRLRLRRRSSRRDDAHADT